MILAKVVVSRERGGRSGKTLRQGSEDGSP